jgi:hypothetical protein
MVMLYQWLTNGNQPQRKILLPGELLATGHERLTPAHRHSALCKGSPEFDTSPSTSPSSSKNAAPTGLPNAPATDSRSEPTRIKFL